MKKKDASFWSDIKTLDERLARDPDSFCFSRLSEIYLKVGLVADALHTARTGVAKHPGYLAGQRALGMACNASGLHDECRSILEGVTSAMPEDVDAQKILAGLYVAAGDHAAAIRTYRTVLDFKPEDAVSTAQLDALLQGDTSSIISAAPVPTDSKYAAVSEDSTEEEIIDLSENDIFEESSAEIAVVSLAEESGATIGHHDPLSTLTLAELYEQQGFVSKALDIYRTILADDPANEQILARINRLEGNVPFSENIPEEDVLDEFEEESDFSEPSAFDGVSAPLESHVFEPVAESTVDAVEIGLPESTELEDMFVPQESYDFESAAESTLEVAEADLAEPVAFEDVSTEEPFAAFEPAAEIPLESVAETPAYSAEPEFSIPAAGEVLPATLESEAFAPLAHKSADNVVDTLDVWLENIRRIKACR